MVRLELAEASGQGDPDRYGRARRSYHQWLADGALQRDEEPSYYLLQQRFPHAGQMLERFSMIGALRLEPLGEGVVPHEQTRAEAKADRLALMESCAANFSPIMGLFRDQGHVVETVSNRAMAAIPEAHFGGDDGQEYTLWRMSGQRLVAQVQEALATRPVYLADGHHRYETALTYRDRRRADLTGTGEAAEFVLMSLTAFDDPGLIILPYHRVVTGLAPSQLTQLRAQLSQVFLTRPLSVDTRTPQALESLVAQEGLDGPAMVLVGPGREGPYLLTQAATHATAAHLSQVETWLLQEAVLRPALGNAFGQHVVYVHDSHQALDMVRTGQAQMAFLMRGLPVSLFERLVGTGVRMPPKSTYFSPKLPSGVVINSLDGAL